MFSIRRASLAFTGMVAACVLVASIGAVLTELRRLKASEAAGDAVTALSYLNKATIEISLERSLSQVGLALPTAFPQSFMDMLLAQRAKSDSLFASLDAHLARVALPRDASFRSQLATLRTRLDTIRDTVDPALAVPQSQRSRGVSDVIPHFKKTIAEMNALAGLVRPPAHATPAAVLANDLLMQRAWIIREYGGRERTYFAIATALGAPVPDVSRVEMHEAHGRVLQSWELSQGLVANTYVAPDVTQAFDAMRARYFEDYTALRMRLYAGADEGVFPISFEDYFAQSTRALDSAVDLVIAAGSANIRIAEEMRRDAEVTLITILALSTFALAISGYAVFYFRKRVSARIVGATDAMTRLANGETDIDVSALRGDDEVGDMVKALTVFRDNAIARADLERRSETERRKELERQDRVEALVQRFRDTTRDVETALITETANMTETGSHLAQQSTSAADRARSADLASAEALQEILSIEEMAGSVSQSIERISEQTQVTQGEVDTARDVARRASENVGSLSRAAERIGNVLALIRSVADQTNLLALNATIEAARAGVAGKGFAIVAAEVKELADQTSKATDEIAAQIADMQSATGETVQSMETIGDKVQSIAERMTALSEAVEVQDEATRGIAGAIERAVGKSNVVATSLGDLNLAVETTNSEAGKVRDASDAVSNVVGDLSKAVENFADGIANDVSERRVETRVQADDPVKMTLGDHVMAARLVDICRFGVKVTFATPLDAGACLNERPVTIAWSGGESARGIIMWNSTREAGIQALDDLSHIMNASTSSMGMRTPARAKA